MAPPAQSVFDVLDDGGAILFDDQSVTTTTTIPGLAPGTYSIADVRDANNCVLQGGPFTIAEFIVDCPDATQMLGITEMAETSFEGNNGSVTVDANGITGATGPISFNLVTSDGANLAQMVDIDDMVTIGSLPPGEYTIGNVRDANDCPLAGSGPFTIDDFCTGNPMDDDCPGGDPDGDNFTNAEEMAGNSDPDDIASTPDTDDDLDGTINSAEAGRAEAIDACFPLGVFTSFSNAVTIAPTPGDANGSYSFEVFGGADASTDPATYTANVASFATLSGGSGMAAGAGDGGKSNGGDCRPEHGSKLRGQRTKY